MIKLATLSALAAIVPLLVSAQAPVWGALYFFPLLLRSLTILQVNVVVQAGVRCPFCE